jgi:hypothetical protein
MPPTIVLVHDEADVLRDEVEAYAARLRAAGVAFTTVRYDGTVHDFMMLNPLSSTHATRAAVAHAIAVLHEAQGSVVAGNILGEPREAHDEPVPRVAFTNPQAAAVGATDDGFSATVRLSDVAKTATYTRAYAESNGYLTLLSDGERLTGAHALGPEAGEWLQQATLTMRARVPLDVLIDTIQPFPTFSEIYLAGLKALDSEIATARRVAGVA